MRPSSTTFFGWLSLSGSLASASTSGAVVLLPASVFAFFSVCCSSASFFSSVSSAAHEQDGLELLWRLSIKWKNRV